MEQKQSVRIQNSILNKPEKKILSWLAARQPRWATSDMLTLVGMFGALVVAAGYILTNIDMRFLHLASLGFVINWYGDSLDGTLARYRKQQRPIYGYYVDHTVDAINEAIMFIGAGLSPLLDLNLALFLFIIYLMLTINVSINAHLKGEFNLTYAKLGPTELRLLFIITNTILAFSPTLRDFVWQFSVSGRNYCATSLDILGIVVLIILAIIYLCTIIKDTRKYSVQDPPHKNK